MRSVFEVFRILIVYGEVVQQLPLLVAVAIGRPLCVGWKK